MLIAELFFVNGKHPLRVFNVHSFLSCVTHLNQTDYVFTAARPAKVTTPVPIEAPLRARRHISSSRSLTVVLSLRICHSYINRAGYRLAVLPEIGPQCSKPGHTLAACFDLCQYLVFVVPGEHEDRRGGLLIGRMHNKVSSHTGQSCRASSVAYVLSQIDG